MPLKTYYWIDFFNFKLNSITLSFITIFLDEIEMGIIFSNGTHDFNKCTKSSHKKNQIWWITHVENLQQCVGKKKKIAQSNG
jgi:hypothetical protein